MPKFVIAGPGTRIRVVTANNIVIGASGDLQLWSVDRLERAYASGEWRSFWNDDSKMEAKDATP